MASSLHAKERRRRKRRTESLDPIPVEDSDSDLEVVSDMRNLTMKRKASSTCESPGVSVVAVKEEPGQQRRKRRKKEKKDRSQRSKLKHTPRSAQEPDVQALDVPAHGWPPSSSTLRTPPTDEDSDLISFRSETELIKYEQDQEFEESLRRDREKERQRKRLEQQRLEEEELQRAIEASNATLCEEKAQQLSSEPASDDPEAVSVCFRLPRGHEPASVTRRFRNQDDVTMLSAYLCTLDSLRGITWKLVQPMPRQVIQSAVGASEDGLAATPIASVCGGSRRIKLIVEDDHA